MNRKRRQGAELQRELDRVLQQCASMPAHLCMICRQARELQTIEVAFADLTTQAETGTEQPAVGRLAMRLCAGCMVLLAAEHAMRGLTITTRPK